jgi:hypothetical protein
MAGGLRSTSKFSAGTAQLTLAEDRSFPRLD